MQTTEAGVQNEFAFPKKQGRKIVSYSVCVLLVYDSVKLPVKPVNGSNVLVKIYSKSISHLNSQNPLIMAL